MKSCTCKNNIIHMKHSLGAFLLAVLLCLSGCSSSTSNEKPGNLTTEETEDAPAVTGHTYIGKTPVEYAECFQIYQYDSDYRVIKVNDGRTYLIVPEGGIVPDNLSESMIVLRQPLDDIYLADSSSMAWFLRLKTLDRLKFSALKSSGWYLDEAVEAMEEGNVLFAGKYSEPDYELLLSGNCDLAIENTMVYHKPQVIELLEEVGIPVFVSRASHETDVLGKLEWIKVFGTLTGKEKEAGEFFEAQEKLISDISAEKGKEQTVAFFYISDSGYAVVRKSDDYVADMIRLGGGIYLPDNLRGDENAKSSVNLSMEEFYASAHDADYLIINANISQSVSKIEELTEKQELLSEFKAVKAGHVWCVGKDFYQSPDIAGEFIEDIHRMLNGAEEKDMTFLTHVRK